MNLFVIYNAFEEQESYMIIKDGILRTKLENHTDTYNPYRRPEPELEKKLLEIFRNGGNEDFKVINRERSNSIVALLERK